MDETSARFELLKAELSALESGIRGYDTVSFQVKGWCVTATLAVAGFAATGRKSLLVIGAVAVIGFWLVDSQNRQLQRAFLRRNKEVQRALEGSGLGPFLHGTGLITSSGVPALNFAGGSPTRSTLRTYARSVLREGLMAHTLGLYLFLLVALGVEALII